MRKNVIALMLVLPLLFMVVFSQMMRVPLGATPSVTSVKIRNKPASGTQTVELLDYSDDFVFSADVYPQAADQTVSVSYEKKDGTAYTEDEEAAVRAVPVEGEKNTFRVVADTVGQTVIRVTSRDGELSDSFTFNVVSSRAYDYEFRLTNGEGESVALRKSGDVYRGTAEPGTYTYSTSMLPAGTSFVIPRVSDAEGEVVIDEASGRILLPFAGEKVRFKVNVSGLPEETATKTVELETAFENGAAPTAKPILVDGNGVTDAPVEYTLARLEEATDLTVSATVYLQTWYGDVTYEEGDGVKVTSAERIAAELYHNCKLTLEFPDTTAYRDCTLTVHFPMEEGGEEGSVELHFSFDTFSFKLRANINDTSKIFENEHGEVPSQALLLDTEIAFSAVSDSRVEGIVYMWDLLTEYGAVMDEKEYASMGGLPLDLSYGDDAERSICTVKAVSKISRVILRVRAGHMVNGQAEAYTSLEPLRIAVEVMENILSLELAEGRDAEQASRSDGKVLTVAGNRYINDNGLKIVPEEAYAVDIRAAKSSAGGGSGTVDTDTAVDIRNLQFGTVTVRRTAEDGAVKTDKMNSEELEREGLRLRFSNTPDGTGRTKQQLVFEMRNVWKAAEVTVPVEWAGNESFGRDVRVSITLNLVKNAVLVTTSDQIFDATENYPNYAVVLGADIMLGTSAAGAVLSVEQRRSMIKQMYSTYNTEYYRGLDEAASAYVGYVLEFKNSLYGNGYSLNAEHFTNAKDGTGHSVLFKGPLDFVRLAGVASVAAQDNIAYLCRTDGVTLYNAVLLGCSDESLLESDGSYDLTRLNDTGTTLEICADVNVLNCRIRNGRNVVRIYGGNRDASEQFGSYFIGSLDRHRGCDDMRINVRIEGCVISYAREFLIKTGSNLALHSGASIGAEPDLVDSKGVPYAPDPERYLTDDWFYSRYVMTDVTLKDSVLDSSGLFSVGMESNFAGPILSAGMDFDFSGVLEGARSWPGTGGTSFPAVLRLEGDVRLYDWKELGRIDSSTLIQVVDGNGFGDLLRLNIASMLDFVRTTKEGFANIIDDEDHVHGGIALYGGGKNYSLVDMRKLAESRKDFARYEINIDVLAESPDPNIKRQGQYLPIAAGTQPFRFYMYDKTSQNSYAAQMSSADKSVKPVLAF